MVSDLSSQIQISIGHVGFSATDRSGGSVDVTDGSAYLIMIGSHSGLQIGSRTIP